MAGCSIVCGISGISKYAAGAWVAELTCAGKKLTRLFLRDRAPDSLVKKRRTSRTGDRKPELAGAEVERACCARIPVNAISTEVSEAEI